MAQRKPDKVEKVDVEPADATVDGTLYDFTDPMVDGDTGVIAFSISHLVTLDLRRSAKYTWNSALSSIVAGDTIAIFIARSFGLGPPDTLLLQAYTSDNEISTTDQMTRTLVHNAWNTFTLDAAFVTFIKANGDLGSGKFAVRLGMISGSAAGSVVMCTEADADLTAPGGGTTHQATASATALAHGNVVATMSLAAGATNIVAKALKSSADSQLALAGSSSATAKAVNTSAIPDVARAVNASVTALATATSADAAMALEAASSVAAKAVVVTAAPDVGAIKAATAHATALARTSGAAAQTALTATASVTAKAVTSGAAAQLSLAAGATNIIAKATKNTADSTLALAASAAATVKAVVTSAAATTRQALIDGMESIVLLPHDNATLFSDTQHWRRL